MIRGAVKGKGSKVVDENEDPVCLHQPNEPQTEKPANHKSLTPEQTIQIADETASSLFQHFWTRRKQLGSDKWSVAELRISFPELNQLVNWLQSPAQLEINEAFDRGWSKSLDPRGQVTNKVVIGFLLHLIYAETVRRFGTEGSYWSCVYNQLPWKESNRRHLFIYNGQPSAFHRELLENSAQTLKMRHTFGIDGVQHWFSTGFLQFGFTHGGFKRRLGEWLAGYHTSTNAIEALTGDPNLKSPGFADLWENLSRYRRGQLTDHQFQERIKNCCWILTEWIPELKASAKEKIHLGTQSGKGQDADLEPEFISQPLLEFDAFGHPHFRCHLEGLVDIPLTAERYTISFNQKPKLDLVRQRDGAYDPTGSEDFIVSWDNYQVQASINDSRTGNQLASQTLLTWQPDEYLQVFSENGRRYEDAFALKGRPGNALHILFPSLLEHTIEGQENSIWSSADDNWKIITLSPETNLKLLLEGEIFWELKAALEPSKELIHGRAFVTNAISVNVDPVDVQSGLLLTTLKVLAHESISLNWVRVGFSPLEFEGKSRRAVLEITPDHLEHGISIQFSVSAFGQRLLIRKRVEIPFHGSFWIRQDGIKYDTPRVLHTQDLAQMKLCARAKHSEEEDLASYCITEGYHFSRRLAKNAIQMSGLSGLGSPLKLQKGLFNQFTNPQILADAVVDGGCIHQAKISADYLTIFPSNFTGLKDEFIAVAWVGNEEGMRLERLQLSESTVGETDHQVWRSVNTFENEHINAIGIFYEGECIGSWWNLSSWTFALRNCANREQAEEYARVIRILNCPILYEENRAYLSAFIRQYPAEALVPWIISRITLALDTGIELKTTPVQYTSWLRATGILFEEAKPDMDLADISLLIEELSTGSKDPLCPDSLARAAHTLTAGSPLLTSRVMGAWLRELAKSEGHSKANSIRMDLVSALEPSEAEIEDIAQNLIRADSFFIRQHCSDFGRHGFDLPSARRDNLPFLFEHSITRRMASAQYLRHLQLS